MKIILKATLWPDADEVQPGQEESGTEISVSFENTVLEETEIMSSDIRMNIEGREIDFDLDELYHMVVTYKALKGET